MARSDTLRADLARLRSIEADLRKDLARYEGEAAKARAAAAKKRGDAARTRSESIRRSALRAAEAEEKKLVAAEKKVAEIKRKIAANAKSQVDKQRSLTSAESIERQALVREEERRRRKEKDHAREIARLSRPIVHHVIVQPPKPEVLRVLYMTANPEAVERTYEEPDGTTVRENTWLRTEAEVRSVQRALRGSKYRDLVEVSHRPAATPNDLLDGINDVRPHVVHFSGHGGAGSLVFDNGSVDEPEGRDLTFELLAKILSATTSPPSLLVLNACDTLDGADVLLSAVPVVVAMADTIADNAASVFATRFYAAIASAQSVGVALQQARVAMEMAALEDADLPECLARDDVDIDSLILVTPQVGG